MNRRVKRRGNKRYYSLFLLAILFSLGVVYSSSLLLRKVDFFKIKKIEVVGNNNLVFMEELAAHFIGRNLFEIKKSEVILAYENIPRIKKVRITKSYPSKLKIKITERFGEFFIRTKEGMLFPIDRERIVLDMNQFYLREDLPIIVTDIPYQELVVGEKLQSGIIEEVFNLHEQICKIIPQMQAKISEYYKKNGDLFFTEIDYGTSIHLGEDELESKIKRLKFVLENRGINNLDNLVDLQFKDMVVFKDDKFKEN